MGEDIQFKHTFPVQLRFSDVDPFGHVNNSVYFSLYDLAKTTYFKDVLNLTQMDRLGIVVANINANFLSPMFFTDEIVVQTAMIHLGTKSFTLMQRAISPQTGEVKCECRTVMVMYDVKAMEAVEIPLEYKQAICKYEGKEMSELSKKI